ncbi:LacI family transcriptional regulator [Dellaglioa algida]|uniref:Transcriptional regulator n=2 Tax=Dellaglioa algida TaxID=105612 RepID=A0A0R1HHR2_9LACO|nr:LacI family DNA-binding transcriptional regulator [Dellaglioa algida]KRK46069.1 transcriptional regulator [Dellaglioa algida DSM 15638]MDK1732078.1 LacI family transcriptional regulator [Dellaglioa algida]
MDEKMNTKANIKDVASKATVSIATVSRFLNGKTERMSKETALKVQAAIKELNYVPNDAARQMITKKSRMIATIVADVDDYFATEMFKGISSILDAQGYTAVLFDSDTDKNREQGILKIIGEKSFDGLIMQPMLKTEADLRVAVKRNLPTIIVDRELSDSNLANVVTNNFDISQQVTKYYMNQGFERVIVITGELSGVSTREERYSGIRSVSSDAILMEVPSADTKLSHTYDKLKNTLIRDDKRTVIFALKERWLLHLLPKIMADGFMANQQVAVTGFSDTEVIKAINPGTSLINQNPFLLGASAAELLLNELNGEIVTKNKKIIIPAEFK